MKKVLWFVPVLFVLGGCPKDDPKPTATTASATASATALKTATAPKIDHDWCKDFIAALEVCAKTPPAGMPAEAYQKQLGAQRTAYEKAGPVQRSQMQSGCQTGLKTLEQQKPACGASPASSASAPAK